MIYGNKMTFHKKSHFATRLLDGAASIFSLEPKAKLLQPASTPGELDFRALQGDVSAITRDLTVSTQKKWLSLVRNPEEFRHMALENFEAQQSEIKPVLIKVLGIGGSGGNVVDHMIKCQLAGVDFICANTDAQALRLSKANQLIQLGASGLGAGSKPEKGRAAANSSEMEIRAAIEGTQLLFIIAGMGGGTGTGAAPVIAHIAKAMGIFTIGLVTRPFDFEGTRRQKNADAGIAELEANVDSLIVVLNEELLKLPSGDDLTQDEAFIQSNDVIASIVQDIAVIVRAPNQVSVDLEDIRTIMGNSGRVTVGTGTASGPERARIAAEQALACPLFEGSEFPIVTNVLVSVSASKIGFKLSESKLIMQTIKAFLRTDTNFIYGMTYDESLGDKVRVTLIATRQPTPCDTTDPHQQEELLVGTDNTAAYVVWSGRTQAGNKVASISSAGVNDLEIPAFLRKQAD